MPDPIRPQPSTPTFLIVMIFPFFNHREPLRFFLQSRTRWFLRVREPYSPPQFEGPTLADEKLIRSESDLSPAKPAGSRFQESDSTIIAIPCPPPMHAVASPYLA